MCDLLCVAYFACASMATTEWQTYTTVNHSYHSFSVNKWNHSVHTCECGVFTDLTVKTLCGWLFYIKWTAVGSWHVGLFCCIFTVCCFFLIIFVFFGGGGKKNRWFSHCSTGLCLHSLYHIQRCLWGYMALTMRIHRCCPHELMKGTHVFQKPRSHLEILSTRRMSWSRLLNVDAHVLGTTIQNLVATVTWCLAFVGPWLYTSVSRWLKNSCSPVLFRSFVPLVEEIWNVFQFESTVHKTVMTSMGIWLQMELTVLTVYL
jgi:hypothetical protein